MGLIHIEGRSSPRRGSVSRFVREMRHLGHTRALYRCELYIDQLSLRVPDTTVVLALWSKGSVKSATQQSKTLHRLSWTSSWAECLVLPEVEIYITSDGRVKEAETSIYIVSADDARKIHGEARIDIGKISLMPQQSFRSTVKLSRCLDPTGCISIRMSLLPLVVGESNPLVTGDGCDIRNLTSVIQSGGSARGLKKSLGMHPKRSNSRERRPSASRGGNLSPKSIAAGSPGSVNSDATWPQPPSGGVLQQTATDEVTASKQALQCYEGVVSENRALKHKLRQAITERDALKTKISHLRSKTMMSGLLEEYNYDALNKQELIRRLQRFESTEADKPIISELEEELIKTKVKLAEVETEKEREIEAARKDARELRTRLHALTSRKRK